MKTIGSLLIAASFGAAVVAACSGDGESTSTGSGSSTTSTSTSTTSTSTSTSTGTTSTTSTGGGGAGGGAGGAGGGPGGAGGAGGAGGDGGGTTSTSTTSTSTTGGGGGCSWSTPDPCGPTMYCDAPQCGAGTCVPIPAVSTEDPAKLPVCGCDGATYWNDSVAASHGMAVSSAGECAPGKFCGGFGNIQCAAGLVCNHGGADASICNIADGGGYCWGMPAMCEPMVGFGPDTRACNAPVCTDECVLIKTGGAWYPDPSCPQ